MATVLVSVVFGRGVDLDRDPDGIGPGFPGRAGAARGHRPNAARSLPLPAPRHETGRPAGALYPAFTPGQAPGCTTRSRPGRAPTATMIAARHRVTGQPVRRKEDARIITGQARWTDNLTLPGMAHLAIVRSPMAHARIARVDVWPPWSGPGSSPRSPAVTWPRTTARCPPCGSSATT